MGGRDVAVENRPSNKYNKLNKIYFLKYFVIYAFHIATRGNLNKVIKKIFSAFLSRNF